MFLSQVIGFHWSIVFKIQCWASEDWINENFDLLTAQQKIHNNHDYCNSHKSCFMSAAPLFQSQEIRTDLISRGIHQAQLSDVPRPDVLRDI